MLAGDISCDGTESEHAVWAQTGWAALSVNNDGAASVQLWGPSSRVASASSVKRAGLEAPENAMLLRRIYADREASSTGWP